MNVTKSELVILVHGTFDTDTAISGTRWWQDDGEFSKALDDATRDRDVRIERLVWSGENSERARRSASKSLAELLVANAHSRKIVIIAHSHGGNVVRGAIESASAQLVETPISVVSVASPFLRFGTPLQSKRQERMTTLRRRALIVFPPLLVTLLLCATFAVLIYRSRTGLYDGIWLLLAFTGSVLILLLAAVTIACVIAARNWRYPPPAFSRRSIPLLSWDCIHSKNDEAITLLREAVTRKRFIAHMLSNEDQRVNLPKLLPSQDTRDATQFFIVIAAMFSPLFLPAMTAHLARATSFGGVEAIGVFVQKVHIAYAANEAALVLFLFTAAFAFTALLVISVTWMALSALLKVVAYLVAFLIRFPFVVLRSTYLLATAVGRQGLGVGVEWIDQLVLQRISLHVLGDDCRAQISDVRATPWDDIGEILPLPPRLHTLPEEHVIGSYAETGRRVRAALGDVRSVIDNRPWLAVSSLMSWSELAHTAYFRESEVSTFILERTLSHLNARASA